MQCTRRLCWLFISGSLHISNPSCNNEKRKMRSKRSSRQTNLCKIKTAHARFMSLEREKWNVQHRQAFSNIVSPLFMIPLQSRSQIKKEQGRKYIIKAFPTFFCSLSLTLHEFSVFTFMLCSNNSAQELWSNEGPAVCAAQQYLEDKISKGELV